MSTRIEIDNTKPVGAAAQQAIALTQSALNQLRAVQGILDSAQTGGVEGIEPLLGLQAGQGAAFYSLWSTAKGAIDVAGVRALLDQSGRG